eukprot:TRINITY_DN10415_c0_g1_i1.p1 TRINITY_DN10415_c0_g1~~TRINITY_DN10415_c0_g1_i1.p1  ORF type:complete len:274 (-),score=57.22 TRINITY_DN10415_c0_g1_i1:221-988(-)
MDNKKARVEGGTAEDALDEAINKLNTIQDELDKINEEASDKVLEVEHKFNMIRRPVYDRRTAVLDKVPDFWRTVIVNHPILSSILSEEDIKVLEYLKALDVEDFKDVKTGYAIRFFFSPNPYFSNAELSKTYRYTPDGDIKVEGTVIQWKEGKDLTAPKEGGEGGAGKKRKAEESDSFFKWFAVDSDTNELDHLNDDIAELLKEDVWSNPLKHYLQEDEEDEDLDEGEEGEEGEEGDEEDDEDDEDGEEEAEEDE